MVAEFRLEEPNMSLVKIESTAVMEGQVPSISSGSRASTGSIVRSADTLSSLMVAVPELGPMVMGGPTTYYQQHQQLPQGGSLAQDVGTTGYNRVCLSHAGASEYFPNLPTASNSGLLSSYNSSPSSYSHGPSQYGSGPSGYNSSGPLLAEERPHSFNSGNAGQSPADLNSLSQSSSASASPLGPSMNGGRQVPCVTFIRSTSTVEYAVPSSMPLRDYGGFAVATSMSSGSISSESSRCMQPPQLHQGGHQSLPPHVTEANRRAHTHAVKSTYKTGFRQGLVPGRGGASNTQAGSDTLQDLLKNQEVLVNENNELKRKLNILVSTFKDEKKLVKVLKCLEARKRGSGT